MNANSNDHRLFIFGRSSSSFTRVTRIFAHELGVDYGFEVLSNLASANETDYAGNPALKIPILLYRGQSYFGALHICRVIARAATRDVTLVWPEHLSEPDLANAQELTLQSLAVGVTLVMARSSGLDEAHPYLSKPRASLIGMLAWLNGVLPRLDLCADSLERLSFLETSLFCLVSHLEFREVADISDYTELRAFRDSFGERPAAKATPFEFDASNVTL